MTQKTVRCHKCKYNIDADIFALHYRDCKNGAKSPIMKRREVIPKIVINKAQLIVELSKDTASKYLLDSISKAVESKDTEAMSLCTDMLKKDGNAIKFLKSQYWDDVGRKVQDFIMKSCVVEEKNNEEDEEKETMDIYNKMLDEILEDYM